MPPRCQIECLLIDLDDTLYDCPQMSQHVAENIRGFMSQQLQIPPDIVAEQCLKYYLNYGTTLSGLVANGYLINYDRWHNHVHNSLPYAQYLQRDVKLKEILDSIPLPKYIFTNADRRHADTCLHLLGLSDCFRDVICFENIMATAEQMGMVHHGRPIVCKPNRQALKIAKKIAGVSCSESIVFFDDSTRNVTSGVRAGVYSVLVGRTGVDCSAHLQIQSMHDLPSAMPWLWDGVVVHGQSSATLHDGNDNSTSC